MADLGARTRPLIVGTTHGMNGPPEAPGRISAILRLDHVHWRARLWTSAIFGVIAGALAMQESLRIRHPRDFGQVWFAARSVLHGVNPYPLVGPGLEYDWPWPLLYPIPAALAAVPFAPFSQLTATVLFVAVSGACFAWTLMEYGYAPLFGFFSLAVHEAAGAGQWSLLLAASFAIPFLSVLLIAKPTIGAVLFVSRPRWLAVIGALVLGAIAFVVQPTWIADWLHAIARNDELWAPDRAYRATVSFPGGILALACLARWRRPEARLVAALACVPITQMPYETVPLFLVPRTFWQTALLVALSWTQHFVTEALVPVPWTHAAYTEVTGRMFVLAMYLPVTIMVLRRRNEGAIPAWLERRIARWPAWLRGASTAHA